MNKQLFKNVLNETYLADLKLKKQACIKKICQLLKDNTEMWGQEVTWQDLGGKDYITFQVKNFLGAVQSILDDKSNTSKADDYALIVEDLVSETEGRYENPPGLEEALIAYFGKQVEELF
jgi:hypothetical protein